VAVWTYALGVTIRVIANEDLWGKVSEAFMESRIQKLEGHFIVAGYTDIGRQVARMFARQKIPFMILDDDSHRLNLAEQDHIPFVLPLNPFLNDSFRRANVAQARGIISSFSDDSDNITVVVTAKIMEEEINRKLLVITVARHQESRAKLTKVGAEVVILPSELIGQRISALAMHPPDIEQSSFLDRVAFGEFRDLDIREVFIKETSALNGVTLRESGIRNTIGAHIVGIQRRGKRRFYLMPSPDVPIRSGDLLLIMGTATQLSLLPGFLEKGPEEQEAALPSESKKPPRKNSKWLLTTESPAPSQPDIPPDDPTLKKKET
jgi:voltage-gated potassium channel